MAFPNKLNDCQRGENVNNIGQSKNNVTYCETMN